MTNKRNRLYLQAQDLKKQTRGTAMRACRRGLSTYDRSFRPSGSRGFKIISNSKHDAKVTININDSLHVTVRDFTMNRGEFSQMNELQLGCFDKARLEQLLFFLFLFLKLCWSKPTDSNRNKLFMLHDRKTQWRQHMNAQVRHDKNSSEKKNIWEKVK